jgi:hypothetical protein
MSKDPAFLFYSNDFLSGVMLMSDEQVGKYIRLLCLQHQKGHLQEKDMLKICQSYDEDIFCKFKKDESGLFYNVRLQDETIKRHNYSQSRSANRKSSKKVINDMNNICKSYDEHMENENVNKDLNKKERSKLKFTEPTIEEINKYISDNKLNVDGNYFLQYFKEGGWIDSKGNKVKNWKQKLLTWNKSGIQTENRKSTDDWWRK